MKSTKGRVTQMRSNVFIALGLLITGAVNIPQVRPQERETATDPKAAVSVSGRVTIRGKGQPGIEIKLIRLNPSTPRAELTVTTDEDGKYRFNEVPAATYQVQLGSKDFFLLEDRGLKILVVGTSEHLKDVDFEMLPGGVVSGRVHDAEGHPLANRLVTLLLPKPQPAQEGALMPAANYAQTDVSGAYRISGAPAGHYFVGVQELLKNELTGSPSMCSETLYPGVIDAAKALAIDLPEGGTVANIDIIVGDTSLCFNASGLIVDNQGVPVAHARYGVAKVEGGRMNDFAVAPAQTDNNGEFRIGGLLPGRYRITLQAGDTDKLYFEPVEFEVVDHNITGLTIKASPGASVSGSLVIEGTSDETVRTKLSQLWLGATVDTIRPGSQGGNVGRVRPDGTFNISGLLGGNLSFQLVSRTSINKHFLLLRIERDGVEQPQSIPLKANEQMMGLKVLVAYGAGSIRGTARYENGAPLRSTVRVALFWPNAKRQLMWSPVDVRGDFLLEGVPAGSYWLELSAYSPQLRRSVSVGKQIEVGDGTASNVTMTLDLSLPSPARAAP